MAKKTVEAEVWTAEDLYAEIKHKDGCPEDPIRREHYTATKPDGGIVTIARCVDCAEWAKIEGELDG